MAAVDSAAQGDTWRRLQFFFDRRLHLRLESLIVLAVLCLVMAVLSPYFLSVSNFLNILLASATIGVLAIVFFVGTWALLGSPFQPDPAIPRVSGE